MKYPFSFVFFLTSCSLLAQITFEDVTNTISFKGYTTADTHGSGLSLIDYDNDGDIDIYLLSEREEPNLFYHNNNGVFSEIGAEIGLNLISRSRMALFFDYNGDGKLDLIIGGDCDFDEQNCEDTQQLRMFRQEEGVFSEITETVGITALGPIKNNQVLGGMAAGDFNNDGFVDLVVTVRNGRLLLLENKGGEFFEEVSEQMRINTNDLKYYQPVLFDINEDGLADIYCNIDFGSNALYINEGYRFRDRARDTNSNNSFNEMGIALGDYDNDADFDIYATNIENYLGEDVHNIMLQNKSETDVFRFTEVSKSLGIQSGGWGWGATFLDADNDGLLDLATTNGWDLPFEVIDQSKFWRNEANNFVDQSKEVGFNDSLNAAALIAGDVDGDGDLDLLQTLKGENQPEIPIRFLSNQSTTNNNYLSVRPRMQGRNRFAVGSIVRCYADEKIYSRAIIAGNSFYGQEPYEAFFGVGQSATIDSLQIIWPGGEQSIFYNIEANQQIELTDENVLHRPSNLIATSDESGVLLTWGDYPSNETGYILERSERSSFTEFVVFNLAADTEEFLDSTAAANSIYYYRLKAINDQQVSNYTKVAEISTIVVSLLDESPNVAIFPNPVDGSNPEIIMTALEANDDLTIYGALGQKIAFTIEQLTSQKVKVKLSRSYKGLLYLNVNGKVIRLIVE